MEHVTIVGNSGSGKSTLAQIVNKKLQYKVYHLDSILWSSGWSKLPNYEQKQAITGILKDDKWIIEGNHLLLQPICFLNSDTIIYIDIPRHICLFRVLLRTAKYLGRERADLAIGCSERFNLKLLKDIWNYNKTDKNLTFDNIKRYGNKSELIILKGSNDVLNFIRTIYKIDITHQQRAVIEVYNLYNDPPKLDRGIRWRPMVK